MQTTVTQSAQSAPPQAPRYPGIERLWGVMRNSWGSDFDRKWAPPAGLDKKVEEEAIEGTKAHWAKELKGFSAEALRYGSENLPPKPCSLIEFKDICRRAPDLAAANEARQLQAPVNKEMAKKAKEAVKSPGTACHDVLFRQREHMQMELDGMKLSPRQREFWRIALRSEILSKYRLDMADKAVTIEHLRAAVNGGGA